MKTIKKLIITIIMLVPFMALASCSETTPPSHELKLTTEYTDDSNFIDNGIGKATVSSVSDGDTASFRLNNKSKDGTTYVTIRFYNIDTPESTGAVEAWGGAASNFTKGILNTEGIEIVLEATNTPAEKDSYGSRYLGYVWYKLDGMSDYRNINVEIVENGFSKSTSVPTDKYYDTFKSAQAYAETNKLHLFSGESDPDYNEDPIEVSFLDLVKDLGSEESVYYNAENNAGAKVRFEAFVLSHTSSSVNYYEVGMFDTDGKLVTFTLYGGYSSDIINSYIKVGSLYSFVGNPQKHNDEFQIAIGQTYVPLQTGKNLMNLVTRDYYCTFDSTHTDFTKNTETGIRSNVTITEATKTGNVLTITGTAYASNKDLQDNKTTTYTFNITVSDTDDISGYVAGASFKVSAIQSETVNTFNISSLSSLSLL